MGDTKDVWTVGDVLSAMSGHHAQSMPDHVARVLQEVQGWLAGAISDENQADLMDIATGGLDHGYTADMEYLFSRIEWASQFADIIPAMQGPASHDEAIVISCGTIVLDEGMRMMVDHAALFASDRCRRIWLVSDSWLMGDIISYLPHIKALSDRGIELRFMLVTPWGYSEIPWSKIA